MPRVSPPVDPNDIINRYLAGESEFRISGDLGVARSTIRRVLIRAGVPLRSQTEAQLVLNQRRTPEFRRAMTTAANVASRGRARTFDEMCARAATIQARGASELAEIRLAGWLLDRGIETTAQQAIGPYNADLGAMPVAVEIFTGYWHAYGRHQARSERRASYILDAGWNLVVVWSVPKAFRFTESAADYVAAFVQLSRADPAFRGQYRMVWSDGEEIPTSGLDLHELARIPPRHRR